MNFAYWVARRYAFSFRSFHFITFISLLSSIGISIGVAALIIVTSLFSGFRHFALQEIISIDPHIRILPKSGNYFDANQFDFNWLVNKKFTFTPFLSSKVIVNNEGNLRVANIFAIPDTTLANAPVNKKVIYGESFSNQKKYFDESKTLVGFSLADAIHLLPAHHYYVYSLEEIDKSITFGTLPKGVLLQVAGIFVTNNIEYDEYYIFASLSSARKMFSISKNIFSGVDIRVSDINKIARFKKEIENHYQNFRILSWFDLNKSIMNAMEFERYAVFIILSLIIVIAVFNVLASLFMTVVDKGADIATIMAFGATTKQIQNIFKFQGLILGTISTFIGLILGLGFCFGQIKYEWFKLNTQKYIISALPMKIEPITVIAIIIVALFLSYLATIFPSKRSTEVKIADAIFRE